MRLKPCGLSAGELLEVRDAIGRSRCSDRLKFRDLRGAGRNDQLAAAPVGHIVGCTEVIESAPALDAQVRFQRPLRIIDSGVDDLGISRTCPRPELTFAVQYQNLAAQASERPCERVCVHACTRGESTLAARREVRARARAPLWVRAGQPAPVSARRCRQPALPSSSASYSMLCL